ncbi:MAG: FAD:protein FMN transferase [Eubacteriales bacterium]|nr:FAD:protein FMN transferase [Eubacteriales bacterium]
MKRCGKNIITLAFFLLTVFFCGCEQEKETDTFYAMGSYIQVTIYDVDSTLLETIKTDIKNVEEKISHRVENSYIYSLNKEKTATFDTETYNMLYEAVEFCGASEGFFDISLLSLTALWDFDSQKSFVPSSEQITEALEKTGYENIYFGENNKITLGGGVSIDLGALGKGYACDKAVQSLRDADVNGIVAVGGSIGVNGTKPGGEYFFVGIRDPFSDNAAETFAGIKLKSGFVSTSGSYEKQFESDGVRYHHIFNTSTGYPVDNELISVSIVCNNGMLSDMLSTACFALGTEKSIPLLEKNDADAVFVTKNKKIIITSGLKNFISVKEDFEVEYR